MRPRSRPRLKVSSPSKNTGLETINQPLGCLEKNIHKKTVKVKKMLTRSKSQHTSKKLELGNGWGLQKDRFRVRKVNFGKNTKHSKKVFLRRGGSLYRVKSCLEDGGEHFDISFIAPKTQGTAGKCYGEFLDSPADETINGLLSLLNHPTESRSAKEPSPKTQKISSTPKQSTKKLRKSRKISLKITKNQLQTRISPLIQSSPKFRITNKTDLNKNLNYFNKLQPKDRCFRQRRTSSHQTTITTNKRQKCQRGSLFLTRMRKKSKTIIIKSPKKRKRTICGFFEENKLRKQRRLFFRLSGSPKVNSSSEVEHEGKEDDPDEDSVSEINILEDEDYLTNKRQKGQFQEFKGF